MTPAQIAVAIMLATGVSPVPIPDHPGGSQMKTIQSIQLAKRLRAPVEIRGVCASACTMWTGYKRACTTKGARFGVHAAMLNGEPDRALTEMSARRSSPTIAAMKRQAFREGKPGNPLRWVSGAVLIARGEVAECE